MKMAKKLKAIGLPRLTDKVNYRVALLLKIKKKEETFLEVKEAKIADILKFMMLALNTTPTENSPKLSQD